MAAAELRRMQCQSCRRLHSHAWIGPNTCPRFVRSHHHLAGVCQQWRALRADDSGRLLEPLTCPACNGPLEPATVRGTVDQSVPCGTACQSATGHTCRCSCGGRKHGIEDEAA